VRKEPVENDVEGWRKREGEGGDTIREVRVELAGWLWRQKERRSRAEVRPCCYRNRGGSEAKTWYSCSKMAPSLI